MDYDISETFWSVVSDLKQVREVEGILDLVRHLTTVAQCEKECVSACGPEHKLDL